MLRVVILITAFAAAAFHLYAAGVSQFTALIQRPAHLAFMAVLGFLGAGISITDRDELPSSGWQRVVTFGLIAAALWSCGYLIVEQRELVQRAGMSTTPSLIAGTLAVVVVLELTRRMLGWPLVIVALTAIAYALAGPYMPGLLAHRGYDVVRLIEHLYLSTEGIWGIPIGVSADFVYLFILFGALLDVAGGGQLMIGLASLIAGRTRGGPAKTAALASGFMGSLSGSAVANVVTTGTLTIPVMRRSGFRPYFAAAIEAAASTGGQLMPPIMGAGAFIMATWTNIPYTQVALAAVVPALLYYAAVFMAIHFRASHMGLEPMAPENRPPVFPRAHLLLPLGIIVAMLVAGRSPMRAAFWGVVTAALVPLLRSTTRLDKDRFLNAVRYAASGAVQVAAACAAAGIVVGVASLTGIGLRMSEFIITLSGGHLPLALLFTAIGSIIMGMGLPTTAAYVVLAALGAPALEALGVPILAAHLFIFYFGCISNVTPPVSLAAFAAAGITDAPPMKTAFTAMALAASGFLVPFMFIYGPPILLDGTVIEIGLAVVTGLAGVTALAACVIGYIRRPLPLWERALMGVAALLLIFPGLMTDVLGGILLAGAFVRPGARTDAEADRADTAPAEAVAGRSQPAPAGSAEAISMAEERESI